MIAEKTPEAPTIRKERLEAYNSYVAECKKLGQFPLGMQAWSSEQRKNDKVLGEFIDGLIKYSPAFSRAVGRGAHPAESPKESIG